MEAYKEGFSAVGFRCKNENLRTGVVDQKDAVEMIKELTRDGCQVEKYFYYFILLNNIYTSVRMTWLLLQCVLTDWQRLAMDNFESRFLTR